MVLKVSIPSSSFGAVVAKVLRKLGVGIMVYI
jgi:hypothetical protein